MLDNPQGKLVNIYTREQHLCSKLSLFLTTPFFWQRKAKTAEIKITIILGYLVVYLLFINSHEAVYLAQRAAFQDAVNSYFLCEAVGHVPGKCSRESFEQYIYPLLNIVFYVANLFLPIVMLLYLINCRILKEHLKKLKIIKTVLSLSSKSSNAPASSSWIPQLLCYDYLIQLFAWKVNLTIHQTFLDYTLFLCTHASSWKLRHVRFV